MELRIVDRDHMRDLISKMSYSDILEIPYLQWWDDNSEETTMYVVSLDNDDRIVGQLSATITYLGLTTPAYSKRKCIPHTTLDTVGVHPAYRGYKCGERMVGLFLEWLKDHRLQAATTYFTLAGWKYLRPAIMRLRDIIGADIWCSTDIDAYANPDLPMHPLEILQYVMESKELQKKGVKYE